MVARVSAPQREWKIVGDVEECDAREVNNGGGRWGFLTEGVKHRSGEWELRIREVEHRSCRWELHTHRSGT